MAELKAPAPIVAWDMANTVESHTITHRGESRVVYLRPLTLAQRNAILGEFAKYEGDNVALATAMMPRMLMMAVHNGEGHPAFASEEAAAAIPAGLAQVVFDVIMSENGMAPGDSDDESGNG